MDNDKIDQHSDEIKVESEEKSAVKKKIEIDEDRLPPGRWQFMSISAGMVKRAGTRRNGATVVSHCGGLSIRRFATGKGIFHVELEGVPGSFLLENLGYTFGFIIVIMARQQLFTENTVTGGTTRHAKPTMSNVGLLMRLWGIVLLGNILGQVLLRGHLNICLSSMKKLAMHLSKSAWM